MTKKGFSKHLKTLASCTDVCLAEDLEVFYLIKFTKKNREAVFLTS